MLHSAKISEGKGKGPLETFHVSTEGGNRGTAALIHNLGVQWGEGVGAEPRPVETPTVQQVRGAPELIWTGKNIKRLAPAGTQTPNRPVTIRNALPQPAA